ncbi:MAG: Gfo/Idh/MocA family oxidoreductase, partial [Clostridiales bacterium]|nr:Gfo/Idh/MocA family oxidoreductase [Clostridiales bacterium]
MKAGIIGCGNICGIYIENLMKKFNNVELVALADKAAEKATATAEKYGIAACTSAEMLANPEIKIIVNLTTPDAHFKVNMAALNAGKHIYSEKPLAVWREEGAEIIRFANENNLYIGCAPDTFLGGGIQTCIKLINDGVIGRPVAATAFLMCRGHEHWHPDPEFYYKIGGGPMLDMGPYYLAALVTMLGSVKRVCGSAGISFPTRTITSEKKHGTIVEVETPTHIAGILDFECGAIGTVITSFDVCASDLPYIEIYGSDATLSVPDPNTFGGPVRLFRPERGEFLEMPLTFGYPENSRGLGLADMAKALQTGRKPRAGVDLTYHVLEAMT